MINLRLLLLILALVCFLMSTIRISHPRIDFTALGLSFWLLATLLGQAIIVP